jgi:phosphodiesterase/alkaline phosphatase D-like protein
MWDDHEVVNDYWSGGNQGAPVDGFAAPKAEA